MAQQPSLDLGRFQDVYICLVSILWKFLQDEGITLKLNPTACWRTTGFLSGFTPLLGRQTLALHFTPICYAPCCHHGMHAGPDLLVEPVSQKGISHNLIRSTYRHHCRSQWTRDLRLELSSLAWTLGSWVRIPLKAWMFVCVYSVFV
jgi:hypothetical protein